MPSRAPAAAIALLGVLGTSACLDPDPAPALARIELAPSDREGTARGFPEMRSLEGKVLAKGEFAQSDDGTGPSVRKAYPAGRCFFSSGNCCHMYSSVS